MTPLLKKMSKEELFNKFSSAIKALAEETDKDIAAQCALLQAMSGRAVMMREI